MSYTNGLDKPTDYFNTKLYAPDGSSSFAVTGVGFQPDLVWLKSRNYAEDHQLNDSVRGATKGLQSNLTSAETTQSNGLTSFDSDGFTVGNLSDYNYNGDSIVSWCWKESATAGFDIVSFTGNGSARTISHSLSAIPKFMIIKKRSNASGWGTYHVAIGAGSDACPLNSTAAPEADTTFWNNTTPTSSVFSVGTNNTYNQNGETYICYLFAEKKGYSKFGSYTGNGNADGTFVYTGQKSAFIMIKRTDSTDGWAMFDNKRNPHNTVSQRLWANESSAEAGTQLLDFLSNGFKPRYTNSYFNGSGGSYIYMAFAENPFVTSTGIPCTAR